MLSLKPEDIKQGQIYYLPGDFLQIPAQHRSVNQYFKAAVHIDVDATTVMVIIKHYKTKECNKVTVCLPKVEIIKLAINRPL